MKTFTVKPIKSHMTEPMSADKERLPTVRVPVDKAWFDSIKVGGDVTVMLDGKLISAQRYEPEKEYQRNEFEIELREVHLHNKSEYEAFDDE